MATNNNPTSLTSDRKKLMKESLQIMNDYYPNWLEDGNSRMICIPPCRDIHIKSRKGTGRFQRPTDLLASNFDAEENVKHKAQIIGEEGESEVLAAFQKCGLEQCVLINGFQTVEFIKHMKHKYPYLGTTLENYCDTVYEIDFLLFHPILGVVICEVKMTKSLEKLEKGKEQLRLRKIELPLLYSTITGNEVSDFPPISLIIFAPRISDNILIKSSDTAFEFVGKETLQDEPKFTRFWSSKILQSKRNTLFMSEKFCSFVAAIVLYRSSIFLSIAENSLHVYERIRGQLQLEKEGAYENVVLDCTPKNEKRKIILNEEQLLALYSTARCQIICGPPGSGKSLVLQRKALITAENFPDCRILISSCANHAKTIKQFMENSGISGDRVHILESSDINESTVKSEDHLFADEMGFSKFSFWKSRSACKGTTTVILTLRFYISDNDNVNFGKEKSGHEAFSAYKSFFLHTILRGTKEIIYHCFPALRSQNRERDNKKTDGNNSKTPEKDNQQVETETSAPFATNSLAIGHSITGTSVVIRKELNFTAILNRLIVELELLFATKKNQSSALSLCDVVVLCHSKSTVKLIQEVLKKSSLNRFGSIEEQISSSMPLIAVDDVSQSLSLEWPIVIYFSTMCDSTNAHSLLAASRAVGHLIVIARDYVKIQEGFSAAITNRSDLRKELQKINENENNWLCRCFDMGIAMFRYNFLPFELSQWATRTFNIAPCTTLCEFIKKMLHTQELFDHFVFQTRGSIMKIESAMKNSSDKNFGFKSSVNKNEKLLHLLVGNQLQINLVLRFANHWCKQVGQRFVKLGLNKFNDEKDKIIGKQGESRKPPANYNWWLALVTALDQFIFVTCDVWFEELFVDVVETADVDKNDTR